MALETQRNAPAQPAAPKAKKTRRGKRGGKEVAAKAARAERVAAARSGVATLEPLPEDGYFTNASPESTNLGPSDVGQSSGASPETPTQPDEASTSNGQDTGADNGIPERPSTPSAPMDSKSEIDRPHPASNGTTHSITQKETDADLTQAVPSAIDDEIGVDDAAIADPQRDVGAHMVDNHLFALDGQGQVLRDAAPAARTSSLMISDEVLGMYLLVMS